MRQIKGAGVFKLLIVSLQRGVCQIVGNDLWLTDMDISVADADNL